MNNNISFTGINNVKMTVSPIRERLGFYLNESGCLKVGPLKYREHKLVFDLFNDAKKADYDEFIDSMAKSNKIFVKNYFPYNPNKIELHSQRFLINDDSKISRFSIFKINGEDMVLSRPALKIYTKLAEITRRISQMPELTEKQQKFAKFLNLTIADEAEKFIELM